jgi:hypothetical protein
MRKPYIKNELTVIEKLDRVGGGRIVIIFPIEPAQ